MAKQRLQKILAAAGLVSRRKCEELILTGVVCVNGEVVNTLPAFADPEKDVVTVNTEKIHAAPKAYYILNKPRGVVCTNRDPEGRKKAIDIIPTRQRIFCVGRLDIDSTGLILLTNDSELTDKLTHPKYDLPKTYVARVKGKVNGEHIEKLKKGIWLAEGKTNRAAIRVLTRSYKESRVEITIRQGLNRQIHRMLAKVGFSVKSLKRTKIGKLSVHGLGVGKFRKLTSEEVVYLKRFSN